MSVECSECYVHVPDPVPLCDDCSEAFGQMRALLARFAARPDCVYCLGHVEPYEGHDEDCLWARAKVLAQTAG